MNVAPTVDTAEASIEQSRPARRVLMVAACPFPVPRGTPARILRMAEALGQRGHDVHVATYHLGGRATGYPFKTHRIRSVPFYTKLDPGPSYQKLAVVDPLLALKVWRLAKELRPDVIHAHHYEGLLAALPARKLCRIPLVYDAHVLLDGELEYYSLGLPRRVRRSLARFLDRRLPRTADHVVVVSRQIGDTLCRDYGYSDDLVTVVPNGVEPEFFRRQRDAFPDDGRRRLIFTGNLARYQGADRMLQALELVLRKHDDVRLVVGTDSDTGELNALARELGVDHAMEYHEPSLDELPSLIASSDVALNPRAKCSGTPQKLMNYLACAVPVVSFEGSGRLLRNEVNALVVPDDDVAAFARAIERLLNQETFAKQLGLAAGRLADDKLSWALNAQGIEAVYSRMLASAAPKPRT